jgi:phosphoribosylformylglycinamidine cyclo-ligase
MHAIAIELIERLNRELGFDVQGLGSYATTINIGSKKFSLHVDGVGTKTIVLQKLDKLWVAGWDCIAMNINDVVCEGAKPVAVVDYISMPEADERKFSDILNGLVEAARKARVAVLGGETAILPDLVNGFDVVCIALAIKDNDWVPKVDVGDAIIGLPSWGLHANGYSLVRKILDSMGMDYNATIDGVHLGEELSKPTAIYSNIVLELIEKRLIKGAAHITGGAFTKIKRILNNNTDAVLNMPKPQKIFELIMKLGNVSVEEMYRVFNMGIGMILVVDRERKEEVIKVIERHGFKPYVLGEIVKGTGKVILNTPYGIITY